MKIKKQRIILVLSMLSSLNFMKAQAVMEPIDHKQQQLQEFQTARVSAAKLLAFGKRGAQKLQDFFAYWELMANTDYPLAMRQQALEAATGCFQKQARLNLSFAGRNRQSPKALLEKALAAKVPTPELLEVEESLALTWDGQAYRGQLKCRLQVKGKVYAYVVELHLQKIKKQFGRENEWVWELQLGDLQPLP